MRNIHFIFTLALLFLTANAVRNNFTAINYTPAMQAENGGITLNGAAYEYSGAIVLTDDIANQVGTVFFNDSINGVVNPSFSAYYHAQLNLTQCFTAIAIDNKSPNCGTGISFVLQDKSPSFYYPNVTVNYKNYEGEEEDTNLMALLLVTDAVLQLDNQIRLELIGSIYNSYEIKGQGPVSLTPSAELTDFYIWVFYNYQIKTFNVYASSTPLSGIPTEENLVFSKISDLFGKYGLDGASEYYVGFTAGTNDRGFFQEQQVLSTIFNSCPSGYCPIGCHTETVQITQSGVTNLPFGNVGDVVTVPCPSGYFGNTTWNCTNQFTWQEASGQCQHVFVGSPNDNPSPATATNPSNIKNCFIDQNSVLSGGYVIQHGDLYECCTTNGAVSASECVVTSCGCNTTTYNDYITGQNGICYPDVLCYTLGQYNQTAESIPVYSGTVFTGTPVSLSYVSQTKDVYTQNSIGSVAAAYQVEPSSTQLASSYGCNYKGVYDGNSCTATVGCLSGVTFSSYFFNSGEDCYGDCYSRAA